MDELIKAVKSLISDIESMRCRAPDYAHQSDKWFGRFSEYDESLDVLDGMAVEWPNLAISMEAVKKLLEPKTIEGELVKEDKLRSALLTVIGKIGSYHDAETDDQEMHIIADIEATVEDALK